MRIYLTVFILQPVSPVRICTFLNGMMDRQTDIFIPSLTPTITSFLNDLLALGDDEQKELSKYSQHSCKHDSDCGTSGFMTCSKTTSKCIHKNVFPLKVREIIGTVVLTVLMALSVMSGIGGGGIIASLLMNFFVLCTKDAISVCYLSIFAGAITRFCMTY